MNIPMVRCHIVSDPPLLSCTPGEEQSPEDTLGYAELTTDELKAAFRIFDDIGDGFISVEKFKVHNNRKKTHPDPSYVHVAMQKY